MGGRERSHDDVGAQRKAARRTAIALAVLAIGFYIAFFVAQSQR